MNCKNEHMKTLKNMSKAANMKNIRRVGALIAHRWQGEPMVASTHLRSADLHGGSVASDCLYGSR